MKVVELPLQGLKLLSPRVFHDERGFFLESYRQPIYQESGIECAFVQDNHSFSKKGTIRGMHFQGEPGQAKLISVGMGEIYDVAVDIRPDSPTFGKWFGVVLNSNEHKQLFIPVGFAHGFCVLSEEAHVFYKVSSIFDEKQEKGFRFDDPDIGIQWPVKEPIVSERDQKSPLFKEVLAT
jgi:dTDP-4-dehydrorhamnose 3,5-epimerase